jgi:hypothetical protein
MGCLFVASVLSVWAAHAPGQELNGHAGDLTVRVQLLSPLTTEFNRKGDMVSARIIEPGNYEGGILEGEVKEIKAAGIGGKSSYVQFEFQTLHMADRATPISASLVAAMNSHRQPDVDEDGSALEKHATGIAGKRNSTTTVRLSAKAPGISFLPGSEFALQLLIRKGP